MVEPAHLQINRDGWAEFAFACIMGAGELEYSRTTVFFHWNGFDEGDEVSGEGSAELQGNGSIETSCLLTTATMPSSSAAESNACSSPPIN
ncbi:MAG: hypothetical protein JO081_17080, partial [Alphaproteobacteria bacterium]|nr:hypothetical protein [Alphaproteobacteria bacterium]